MSNTLIFGGTGFLGRNIIKRLFNVNTTNKIIIASRDPSSFQNDYKNENIMNEQCDITKDDDIMNLFEKYQPQFAIKSIGFWRETPSLSFESVHYYPTKRIVNECNKYGTSFGYLSGLGLDPNIAERDKFKSKFLQIRSDAERIIIENHENNRKSRIFRAGGIIDDSYPLNGMLKTLIPLLYQTPRYLPMPSFGNGQNKMSLISINDLSQIVVDQLFSNHQDDDINDCKIIELGNPKNDIRYIDLIQLIHKAIYNDNPGYLTEKLIISIPFFVWFNLAKLVEASRNYLDDIVPLEKAQVELMMQDLIAKPMDELKDLEYQDCFQLIKNAVNNYGKKN